MILEPIAREWYALEIATSPAVTAWEASFDGGATWLASTAVGTDGYYRWLVAGPKVNPVDTPDPQGATVLALGRTLPKVRATQNPEVVVRDAPAIDVR